LLAFSAFALAVPRTGSIPVSVAFNFSVVAIHTVTHILGTHTFVFLVLPRPTRPLACRVLLTSVLRCSFTRQTDRAFGARDYTFAVQPTGPIIPHSFSNISAGDRLARRGIGTNQEKH